MSKSKQIMGLKSLKVKIEDSYVGTLALSHNGMVAFSYDKGWLARGFSISPFSLPLEEKVFVPNKTCFEGLFGVFADSLPDAWGRLLLKRILEEQGNDRDITVLDRLAMIGKSGMGALEYEPEYDKLEEQQIVDLDHLSRQCQKILNSEYTEELDVLYRMGGSSGGARPKILTQFDDKKWMIKFPSQYDSPEIGVEEWKYSLCAKNCGIIMPETKLFPSKNCGGYFGTVRFDVIPVNGTWKRIHTMTAAALLEADFRAPCLDYNQLMKLTRIITRDRKEDMENMFRRMCFNVYAHNRDDHAKNFSYQYDSDLDSWKLSPAYDLTYSNTYFGEHTTSVDGNGKNPGEKELLSVGLQGGLKKSMCMDIISEIKQKVKEDLETYLHGCN